MIWGIVILLLCILGVGQAVSGPECHTVMVNRNGASQADITVSTSAVTIVPANSNRCNLIITNTAVTANTIRCAPNVTPTSTVGYLLAGGATLTLTYEGQQAWQCIRAAAADATVSVIEGLP